MFADAMFAVESGKDEDTETLIQSDVSIDSREVETERESETAPLSGRKASSEAPSSPIR
jgi:hypothetical protein